MSRLLVANVTLFVSRKMKINNTTIFIALHCFYFFIETEG